MREPLSLIPGDREEKLVAIEEADPDVDDFVISQSFEGGHDANQRGELGDLGGRDP